MEELALSSCLKTSFLKSPSPLHLNEKIRLEVNEEEISKWKKKLTGKWNSWQLTYDFEITKIARSFWAIWNNFQFLWLVCRDILLWFRLIVTDFSANSCHEMKISDANKLLNDVSKGHRAKFEWGRKLTVYFLYLPFVLI